MQIQNYTDSKKNTEIKCPDNNKLFVGCCGGFLLEDKTVYDSNILDLVISSIAKNIPNFTILSRITVL